MKTPTSRFPSELVLATVFGVAGVLSGCVAFSGQATKSIQLSGHVPLTQEEVMELEEELIREIQARIPEWTADPLPSRTRRNHSRMRESEDAMAPGARVALSERPAADERADSGWLEDEAFAEDTAAPPPSVARFANPIGLYGERISESRSRSGPQGRGNLTQISFLAEGACFDPTLDRTGERVAFASTMHGENSNLYVKSVNGSTVTQLTSDPADDVMPCFNPAGDKVAFASNRAGRWDVYITSINGGPAVQLTNDDDHEIHPTWSPDGRHIAYCKFNSRSERWEIWAAEVANPGVKRFLEYGMFPRWSPDLADNKILFQRPRQRGSRLHGIWTVDFVNGEAVHPTEIVSAANAATINPSWSPDGKRIVFVTVVDPETSDSQSLERSDLWVVNVDGGGRTKLTDGQFANYQPVWAGDGYIYFISNRSGHDNIWALATENVIDLTQPNPRGVAEVPTD